MKTAKLIKDNLSGYQGYASLYLLSDPLEGNDYVVCNTVSVMFTGLDTHIFASNKNGEVNDWGSLKVVKEVVKAIARCLII